MVVVDHDSPEKPVDNSPIIAHQPSTTSPIYKSSSSSAIAHRELSEHLTIS